MAYIYWLLQKLTQEVNFGSDDADEILGLLQSWANTGRRYHYVSAIRKLWNERPRTQNLKNYIICFISSEFNTTSLLSQADLCLVEFRLMAELFIDFHNKSLTKPVEK